MARLWFLIGFLVFAACDGVPPTTSATADSRLVITRYVTGLADPDVWFINDTVAHECWIVVAMGKGVAMLPAHGSCTRGEK